MAAHARATWLRLGAAALVLGVAAAVAVILLRSHGSSGTASGGLSPTTVMTIQDALDSGSPDMTRSVIAAQDASTFDATSSLKLAALHVRLDRKTFRQEQGYGTVEATTAAGRWLLTLVVEDGQWKISDTRSLS